MAFTKAQTDAMNARGRALLVSAAAGSGKTFTLTRRIIDSIIADEKKTLGRMLIVTFTRSAAAELKKKISDALAEAIADNPDNEHLQDELLKLGGAHISTIDSFFSSPVRENFEKLGLPASMRLADDAELQPLRESILKDTLELFFCDHSGYVQGELAEVGHSSVYTDLLSLMTGIRDTSRIVPAILDIYKNTLTSPDGVKALKKSADRLYRSASRDFFETAEGRIIRSEIKNTLIGATVMLESLRDEVLTTANNNMASNPAASPKFAIALKEKVYPVFVEDAENCQNLLKLIDGDYPNAFEFVKSLSFSSFPSLRGDNRSGFSESFMASRNKQLKPLKAIIGTLIKYSPQEISKHFRSSAAISRVLYDLLAEFDRRYSAEKLARGICEFSDMPKFMLKLLENEDGTPTALALSMQKQYDEVYIDEYQDVNAIQDRIFEIIGGNRRFMVGDIKQSIYCFRDAEPSIFAGYRSKFPAYNSKRPDFVPKSGGSSIFMSENFRCDKGIIDFVNYVCDDIFSSFADSIGYDKEKDQLKFGKISDHFDPPKKVILNVVEPADNVDSEEEEADSEQDTEEESTSKLVDEATVCANEIARLIRDKNEVNADGSPVRAGDIAILVRGHAQIEPIADALTRAGIKYVTNAKNKLLDSNEMKLLADILSVIDNPREDIPLCRVLTASLPYYSPILTLDDIVMIKTKADGKATLFDALVSYTKGGENQELREKCSSFVSMLDDYRKLAAKVAADKLLRAISRDRYFAELCESDAYTYLYSTACKYVRNAWNGLYSFISYFKGLMEKGSSNSDPIKAQSDEVTIITMHQSKGLEYKVCFLFGLGTEMNFKSLSSPLIFNRELGISMKLPVSHAEDADVYSKTQVKREENIIWKAATILAKNKMLEEEARVFYVAMTRAKERLYLSATLNKPYKDIQSAMLLEGRDYVNEIRNGKSYIRWTMISLLSQTDENDLFILNKYPRNKIQPISDKLTREEVESSAYGITETDKTFAAILNDPHGETDEEKLLSMIPAKVAASKVSESMLDKSIFIPVPTGKIFSDSDEDAIEQSSDTEDQIKHRIELIRSKKTDFDSLLEINKKPTAAEKGSAAHLFLQFCDYEKLAANGLDAEIERLKKDRFITERTATIIDRKQLSGFFGSELFALIKNAANVRREFRFGMFRSASDFTSKDELKELVADKKIFVQGSIDLIVETADGKIILCDYKTDRISEEERADRTLLIENMRKKHAAQLEEYRYAVNQIFGKAPSMTYIYSVPLGEVIEI